MLLKYNYLKKKLFFCTKYLPVNFSASVKSQFELSGKNNQGVFQQFTENIFTNKINATMFMMFISNDFIFAAVNVKQ